MDASASSKVNAEFDQVYGFFLKIENSNFPCPKQKNTVIKYTKLPDFDFDSRISWPKQSYTLPPRLRRIISVDNPEVVTSCSLRDEVMASKTATSNYTKRKIVTISEDDETDPYPKLTRSVRKSSSVKTTNRSVAADIKEEKQSPQRATSRLTNSSKYHKEPKNNMKTNNINSRKEINITKINSRNSSINQQSIPDNTRTKKGKDTYWNVRCGYTPSKDSLSKKVITASESEKEISVIRNKMLDNTKIYTPSKKAEDRTRLQRLPTAQTRKKEMLLKDIKIKNKPTTLIHVPLDEKYQKEYLMNTVTPDSALAPDDVLQNVDCGIETKLENIRSVKHVNVGTDPSLSHVDQGTEMDPIDFNSIQNYIEHTNVQTEVIKEIFDSLQIPNVTLTKDKSDFKDEIVKLHSKSLPNLKVPALKVTPNKEFNKTNNDSSLYKSSSYIISRATVTCTTRQEIDFHVVEDNDYASSNRSQEPLPYPINVMSVIKKEMSNRELNKVSFDDNNKKKDKSGTEPANRPDDNSLNCSYVFNRNKLVKPSDIISTIRLGNGLLRSDYICEQFQRELNFIDSFFESLQYLESCSLSDKGFPENKVHSWVNEAGFDVKSPDYGPFLPSLENGTYIDDSETMASKSLCLLNLLIRDEQRRAKNLLFVLKMREDALKDFTKSQILWLEDKKKQENIDISTLKKKQRGALLKLQHECGEMQRMRKALLTLTEKRKVALMKTKKNIELKLSNSLNVDQILIGKKKLKKCTIPERITTPLKCFDLSSSGCDDSTTSRAKSDMILPVPESLQSNLITRVSSAEKSIQTGDSVIGTAFEEQSTGTAAEHFVVVDGGYLNILFHNLSLPQIFSCDKQYEVNEEALKHIVNSTNTHRNSLNDTSVLEKLMDQIKNPDLESSTPSTARSLVEELDQYYKGLTEADKSSGEISDRDYNSKACEVKDVSVQVLDSQIDQCQSHSHRGASTASDSSETVKNVASVSSNGEYHVDFAMCPVETEVVEAGMTVKQTGPLPVPVGAAASGELQPAEDLPLWLVSNTSSSSFSTDRSSSFSSESMCANVSSMSSLTSPVHCEAEQLRRQQLAIEREIKALEQQQCQLLVVREIPDKPPPPYTPPTEMRIPKKPRMFLADDSLEDRVNKYISNPDAGPVDPTDGFDAFVNEFCHESLQRQKAEIGDKPWDACNLLPQKPQVETEKIFEKTTTDLSEVLMGVAPTLVSGVSSRRSDHIDDILFAEWRRCEPEWTSLHTDEAIVKNQLFDSIFQKILTETIDEYKSIVECNK